MISLFSLSFTISAVITASKYADNIDSLEKEKEEYRKEKEKMKIARNKYTELLASEVDILAKENSKTS